MLINEKVAGRDDLKLDSGGELEKNYSSPDTSALSQNNSLARHTHFKV